MWVCPSCETELDIKSKWQALAHVRECRAETWTCVDCDHQIVDDRSMESDIAILEHALNCYY